MGRLAAPALSLLLCGFSCGPRPLPPVSLESAEKLEREGKSLAAAVEYARLLGTLRERADAHADAATARICARLFALRVWELAAEHPEIRPRLASIEARLADPAGRPFLSAAMEAYLRVLTTPSGAALRAEAAAFLADAARRKAGRPELQACESGDRDVHRLLLLEAACAYEHRRASLSAGASRAPLAESVRALAEAYRALAGRPRAREFARERWREIAEAHADLAVAAEREEELPPLPEDFARWADFTMERHLREATQWSDRGTVERSTRGDLREAERCYRTAMRHFAFAAETLTERTPAQENCLSAGTGVARAWKTLCFEDR
ncbi:MAG: hypothetical protein HYY17_16815 [Planctomycetes bacterium]|nr:hypothetical protein [Planctomycetota bacterium]